MVYSNALCILKSCWNASLKHQNYSYVSEFSKKLWNFCGFVLFLEKQTFKDNHSKILGRKWKLQQCLVGQPKVWTCCITPLHLNRRHPRRVTTGRIRKGSRRGEHCPPTGGQEGQQRLFTYLCWLQWIRSWNKLNKLNIVLNSDAYSKIPKT